MLRVSYTICEILGTTCAVVSPVVIFHWLLRIVNLPSLNGLVGLLNPLFDPLNQVVGFIVHTPPIQFNGQEYATTQGVLAVLLTVAFFGLNFLAESLKAGEQRMDIGIQAAQQRIRLQKLRETQQRSEKRMLTNRKLYLFVQYDFSQCQQGGAYLESAYIHGGGKLLAKMADSLTLCFDDLAQAMAYCLGTSQHILGYYATLRPMDPQPPFKMGLQAMDGDLSQPVAINEVRKLINFVGDNQVLFSQDAKDLLEAKGLAERFRYQSIGMYSLGERQQELFRLFFSKANTNP